MSRRCIWLLFCCLRMIHAQAADHPVRYLGIEQGLSNNAVTTIYQDKLGFMWFGTYDGLNRYDGYSFQVFRNKPGDTSSLIGNSIYTIAGDAHDNLWIGAQKGACVLDPRRKKFTWLKYLPAGQQTPVLLQDDIHTIMAVDKDLVLVGTNHLGLIVFNKFLGKQVSDKQDVTALEKDGAGNIWVFINQQGLFRYANGRLTLVNNTLKDGTCLRSSSNGHLWLGNKNGLFEYDPQRNTWSGNRSNSNVVHIREDKRGVLWIGSDGGGLLVMNQHDSTARPFTPLLNSNSVYAIYEDTDQRKWIGTLRGGINTIEANPESFKLITHKSNHPASDFILSFAEDAQHNLWIGTDGAGLRYWNRQNNTFTEYGRGPTSLSSNFITGLVCDARNRTWIATWFGGINSYDPVTKRFTRYTCFNPVSKATENNVWALYIDKQQRLWASATNDGSLYLYNTAANKFELFDHRINNLQCITEDDRGNLWGGNYHSLVKIDRVHKHHVTYNVNYTIRSIHQADSNRLWLGTQEGGLLLFDAATRRYQRFTTNEGLANNTVLRILQDKQGDLWLSTFNGLSKFDPHKKTFRNFFQSDGLQSNQFSFNAALALQNGEMAFGGIRGFNLFNPDSVYDQVRTPPVYLTNIHAPSLTVPFNQAALTLQYLALDYSGADKISYAYLLDGWDKTWNYVNDIRTANYSNLREGNYRFIVKIKTEDGLWHEGRQLLQLTVLPPWYRTWWAYSLYVLLLALGIYLYILYSRRQERLKYEIKLAHLEHEKDKELNEKKLSFFTNISHEFRTPLSLIINPLKDHTSQPDLNIAYRNARRLLSLVDQLLLFRKADSGADRLNPGNVNIISLCNEVYQCFIHQARTRSITYHFITGADSYPMVADAEKIEIALFNLLSNAFKFTPDGGAISLEIRCSVSSVTIIIRDSGCGIDMTDSLRIFEKFQQVRSSKAGFGIGLYLVKHFIERHQGSIAVASTLNKGTEFTISLPITKQSGAPISTHHELLDELKEEPLPIPKKTVTREGRSADELITEKKSLLIVDDDPEIREYMTHIFHDKYILYHAADGVTGLQAAEEHAPDLIISDINMDGFDGLELCRRIKQSATIGHIPVILLTAASGNDSKLKGIEGGADDYITKPFDIALLQARVETILKNRNLLQRYFFDHITLQESAVKAPAEYREFLRNCIRIVEENLDKEDFTIQRFCKAMGMSRSSLYQKVKHISGQSLNAFIRSIRLRRAAVLMLKENMNVNQAAFQVGIGDVRYFREQFVKLFGMTPSDYIKKYRPSFRGDLNLIRPEDSAL